MRPRQTILLGLLLLVPVLAFLFLYGFGRNHYALPTFLPERLVAGEGGQRDTVYHQVRPLTLLGPNGRLVSAFAPGEHALLVQLYPLYDKGSLAEAALRAMARVQEKFRLEPRVRLLTLVADSLLARRGPLAEAGRSLTQSSLEALATDHGAISGKWRFLAGAPDTLRRLARAELGQTALRPAKYPFKPNAELANLLPGRLLLVDRAGHVRGYYDAADKYEVERLITEINVLLYTYDHRH